LKSNADSSLSSTSELENDLSGEWDFALAQWIAFFASSKSFFLSESLQGKQLAKTIAKSQVAMSEGVRDKRRDSSGIVIDRESPQGW
jgi:hypothetical protein